MAKRNIISVQKEIAGRVLSLQYGRMAEQASCAVEVRYGDTMMLCAATLGRENPGLGYFPLSIEYSERLYAAGKIKGSRWVKREGRPTDYAVLTSRLVDRSVRPLFPKELKNEVQVVMTELSYDGDNETDIAAFIGASAALAGSNIPWNGPVVCSKVGLVDGQFVLNPTAEQRANSTMELLVSSSRDLVNMIEFEGEQVVDQTVVDAIAFAHEHSQAVLDLIEEFVEKLNPVKVQLAIEEIDAEIAKEADKEIKTYLKKAKKPDYFDAFDPFVATHEEVDRGTLDAAFGKMWKKAIRAQIASGTRTDGRKIDEIRELSAEVDVVPRVHGSALFSRGSTQALSIATLGSPGLSLLMESTTEEGEKHYMHHYNFPPYSVGETGRMRGPGRREIGHGILAEKALEYVIPDMKDFPYTIRVVSEITSSNGSTSQASISGSTLALMAAGVPIKAPIAGVAMGLISDAPEGPLVLSDIAGIEDFNGDMDFKVAGSTEGITAIQLDVKIPGLTLALVQEIIDQARADRLKILEVMHEAIAEPRASVGTYAPKVATIQAPTDKIGEIIGPGGKMIRKIIAETGAEIDVNDDGLVTISAVEQESLDHATEWVKGLVTDPEVGAWYEGPVTRLMNFGVFVEILPGKEGLVHVSKMSVDYVESPGDVVQEGQIVKVRVTEIDDMGRVNLSMLLEDKPREKKDGSNEYNARPRRNGGRRSNGGGRNGNGGGGHRGGGRRR